MALAETCEILPFWGFMEAREITALRNEFPIHYAGTCCPTVALE